MLPTIPGGGSGSTILYEASQPIWPSLRRADWSFSGSPQPSDRLPRPEDFLSVWSAFSSHYPARYAAAWLQSNFLVLAGVTGRIDARAAWDLDEQFQRMLSGPLAPAFEIILLHCGSLVDLRTDLQQLESKKIQDLLKLRLRKGTHEGSFRAEPKARSGSYAATWIAVTALKRALADEKLSLSQDLRKQVSEAIRTGELYLDHRSDVWSLSGETPEVRLLTRVLAIVDTHHADPYLLQDAFALRFPIEEVSRKLQDLSPTNDRSGEQNGLPTMADFLVSVLSILSDGPVRKGSGQLVAERLIETLPTVGRYKRKLDAEREEEHVQALSSVAAAVIEHQDPTSGAVYDSPFLTGLLIAACEKAIGHGAIPPIIGDLHTALLRAYRYLEPSPPQRVPEKSPLERQSSPRKTQELRRSMSSPLFPGFQGHHVLPDEFERDAAVGPFLREIEFNLQDGLINGIQLPASEAARSQVPGYGRATIHNGYHPLYTQEMRRQVLAIQQYYQQVLRKQLPLKVAEDAARLQIIDLVRTTQKGLRQGKVRLY